MIDINDALSPKYVGIRNFEFYFPRTYVKQKELEKYNEVSPGKYTIGFGQEEMSFCGDHEDVVSICLTVVSKLLENNQIDPKSIGFLAVGSETIIDKSKSIKSELMKLFADNTDIEGVDVKNACFGGTQALFHAVDWVYANWGTERRYAIVVMGDIAVYEAGPARCTGGAAAFATLIGPDALLYFDRGLRANFMLNRWDFYKPVMGPSTEYPEVDGALSLKTYLGGLDAVYKLYLEKAAAIYKEDIDISAFQAVFFHCPFSRLVQKALSRLAFIDFTRGRRSDLNALDQLEKVRDMPIEQTYLDRGFSAAALASAEELWKQKCLPNLLFNIRIGNMYTSSVFSQLVAFFCKSESFQHICGKRLLFYSYGSGAASAMFSATIRNTANNDIENQYRMMKQNGRANAAMLEKRICVSPVRYTEIAGFREKLMEGNVPIVPKALSEKDMQLFPGSFYLKYIDERRRRCYARLPI